MLFDKCSGLPQGKRSFLLPGQFKHISLFSATEGSSVMKGRRQQLCCGDYCNLLKPNDVKTSEKIELLIKSMPEFSEVLFKLLKIQNFLNLDSAQSLFNGGNRAGTPLTLKIQFKTIRRIILEDRNDQSSLRSVIAALPEEILKELDISPIKVDQNQNPLHRINKKLSWEYELVPVCNMCYKIYNLTDSQNKYQKKSNEKSFSHTKLWKINESKYKIKSQIKQPALYIDYDKMLKTLYPNDSKNLEFIKNKIINSNFVSHKKPLQSKLSSISTTPLKENFTFNNKISSTIINKVCERYEEVKELIRKSTKNKFK
jgi:hypothetical protein